MARSALSVLVADVLLLLAVYLVLDDRTWRLRCALGTAAADCTARSSPHFSYSLFTLTFSMTSDRIPGIPVQTLQSPPTLDWVQVLVAALVVLNAWYVYALVRSRRGATPQGPQA